MVSGSKKAKRLVVYDPAWEKEYNTLLVVLHKTNIEFVWCPAFRFPNVGKYVWVIKKLF